MKIIPEKNINENKCIFYKGIYFDFSELNLSEMNYKGYTYYLPMKNGKGKMIKNKTVKLTVGEVKKYDWEGVDSYYVIVKSFELVK